MFEHRLHCHVWSGRWPTDEYPKDGTRIRYQKKNHANIEEGVVHHVWCGIEPMIVLTNGTSLFTWDAWEVIPEAGSTRPKPSRRGTRA